jgi:hypothetical protein
MQIILKAGFAARTESQFLHEILFNLDDQWSFTISFCVGHYFILDSVDRRVSEPSFSDGRMIGSPSSKTSAGAWTVIRSSVRYTVPHDESEPPIANLSKILVRTHQFKKNIGSYAQSLFGIGIVVNVTVV